ncbi:hypothetical protein [Paenibacillus turpanensis]|uniref:hypothetical protein n=1 Tax=Paenibacillus turpanensis TaxID=2689078 RepID=UPI00140B8FAB|nr:hypothetical protein [Paenibacillus turpanensis]
MSLANCKQCGKLLINSRFDYCQPCLDQLAHYQRQIREFLKENPKSTIWDVHVRLSIPLSVVQHLIKENFEA